MKYIVYIIILHTIITPLYGQGNQEQEPVEEPTAFIGISLIEQRTRRWATDTQAIQTYAQQHSIPVRIYFSDNDEYLQTYQIDTLIDSGIQMLIISAPDTDLIRASLQKAKKHNIYIIAYDTLITHTEAIDFFIGFDTNAFGNSYNTVDIQELKQVIDNSRRYIYFMDTRILATRTLELGFQFLSEKPSLKNYQTMDNGTIQVPALLLAPTVITKENYIPILIDSNIISQDALQ